MVQVVNLQQEYSKALEESTRILNSGGIIVFPTDTVYGLAARMDDSSAIQRIFSVKGREQTKALAVLIGEIDQVDLVGEDLSPNAKKLMDKYWPGGLTIVLKKNDRVLTPLSQDNSIGVRLPDDDFVRLLTKRIGPLATTSANKSGYPSTTNVAQIKDQLGDLVDLIIDGGESPGGISSTVVDCRSKDINILRVGALSPEEIKNFLVDDITT